jgi:hypothetical protein
MADPSREPTDSKLPYGLWNIEVVPIWLLPFCVVLSEEEINRFVARLFDKDPLIARPVDLPLPSAVKTLLRW